MQKVNSPFFFDEKKALEVVLFIANKCDNLYNLLKILYYADKEHLDKYGRFICGDNYVLLPHGPVPSKTYDIVKNVRDNRQPQISGDLKSSFDVEGQYKLVVKRPPNLELLSKTDIECLDKAIEKYGDLSFEELKVLSHKEPDVIEVKDSFDENIYVDIMAKYFEDGDLLLEYLNC